MRKELILSAMIATLFAFVSFSANAMPATPLSGISKDHGIVTQVRGGCGRGWHRGPRGGCRRNW